MVHFGTLHPDGRVTNQRDIPQESILACPHAIMVPEHYRDDGSCRCNDSDHTIMAEWGYEWGDSHWIASDDDDDIIDDELDPQPTPQPFAPTTQADIDGLGSDGSTIPLIGDEIPDGWTLVDRLFVDSSGFGRPGEAALTQDQFKQAIEIGKGYAIIKVGQFQLYVGVFERIPKTDAVESPTRS